MVVRNLKLLFFLSLISEIEIKLIRDKRKLPTTGPINNDPWNTIHSSTVITNLYDDKSN